MPNTRATVAYKRQKLEGNREKRKEYKRQYRESRRDKCNRAQALLMRSRRARFLNGNCRNDQLQKHRRKNQEMVARHRQISPITTNVKRKIARKRWDTCVHDYERAIREYHSHVCNCCGRLFRISQLQTETQTNLLERGFPHQFIQKVFWVREAEQTKFCMTCLKDIRKKIIPKLCLCNGLEFPKVDKKISKLNRIEERLIAARHVFQTLWTVKGPTGQYKTKGGIVNVPVEVDNTVCTLPRSVHDSNMIHVRLARKMEYLKDYMSGIARPKLLYDAAKALTKMPLAIEQNITLSVNWNDDTNNFDCEYETDLENEFYTTSAIHETMLTNTNCSFTGMLNDGIRMAPAEGFRPTSILFDETCEYLAFPKVFGGHKMNPQYNNKPISYAVFAKSMAMRYDRRVAERGDLLLFIAKKLELLKLYNNIGICLRKKSSHSNTITATDMLNASFVEGLVQHDEGYKFLAGIRNSPSHWQNEKTRLLAQIRQFGLPTLFITLSSGDVNWPELLVSLKFIVDKEIITEHQASELPYSERARLVQKDPVTCALHFDERFKALKKTWDSPDGPFHNYKISHFYHRIEFQQRGSPHVHMLVWLEGAPQYGSSSTKDVISFIDSIISCSSDEIPQDLVRVQTHSHSTTCKKKNGAPGCRFDIPYFPMKRTRVLTPIPDEKFSDRKLRNFRQVLKSIKSELENVRALNSTFEEFLGNIGCNHKKYLTAIRLTLSKPQIFLKRSPKDIFISPYSQKMISLMRSNQNIQFVLDAYGAACYIIDYINKSDRGMSNIMRETLKQIRDGNNSLHDGLKKLSSSFHNNSELSIQEACYNILQLHLSEGSERCIFIPTFPPENRVRMVRSREALENLPENSTEIFVDGLINHYCDRPFNLEKLTLAEFAASYRFSKQPGNNAIALLHGKGYIYKTRKPYIIRYRNYHYETDPDNFIREHLMLYLPWRDENKDIIDKNMEYIFTQHEKEIKKIKKMFNALDDKTMNIALHEASNRDDEYLDNDSDSEIVGETTSEMFSNEHQMFDFDSFHLDEETQPYTNADSDNLCGSKTQMKFTSPSKLAEPEYQSLFEVLNQEQRDYVMHVASHFQNSNEPLYHFLTGGAGVGKSHVIKTLFQTLIRLFDKDTEADPDQPKVLLCAPTGKASFNIGGQTLHSAFRLPLNQRELQQLSPNVSNSLACALQHLKVIIIDEISMVSQHILDQVSQRLQHLHNNNLPFGGVSVIAVGDFFQLRPVFGQALFHPHSNNPYSEIFGDKLWKMFKVFQLTRIMRQNETHFQIALNNLAKGKLTEEDITLFKSRSFTRIPQDHNLDKAIHLFYKNVDVDDFNAQALKEIPGSVTKCKASDILQGHGSDLAKRQLMYSASKSETRNTMGIPRVIHLKVGAQYMITYNLDTDDGLCNGATGKLKRIDFGTNSKGEKKPLRLWLKFHEKHVGLKMRQIHSGTTRKLNLPSSWTPIFPIAVTVKTRKNSSLKVSRKQFPLTLAHALTIHKSQGQSLKKVVVHIKKNISRELLYVACSRATTLGGLFIIGHFQPPRQLDKNSYLAAEIKRWKKNKVIPMFQHLHKTEKFQLMYHNVQSLHKHLKLITNDLNFTSNDVIILGETWMTSSDKLKIPEFDLIEQTDNGTVRKPRGVCIFVRKELKHFINNSSSFVLKEDNGRIDTCWLKIRHITIIGVYVKPVTSLQLWKHWFKTISPLQTTYTIILGDFNRNFLVPQDPFKDILKKRGFKLRNAECPTTHSKTGLDWIISNFPIQCGTYASFFSYHHPIWTKLILHDINPSQKKRLPK